MTVLRTMFLLAAAIGFLAASPASAQFFFKSRDLTGTPVTGSEPGILPSMPGATPDELSAGLVWELRSALNVAALSLISFSGFLVEPPLVGFVSEMSSLRYGLAATIPILVVSTLLAGHVRRRVPVAREPVSPLPEVMP